MKPARDHIPYPELYTIGECLLDEVGEDENALNRKLEVLPEHVRNELLVSDILNAWQVFYYFFRIMPDDLVRERLELEPASSVVPGILINEIELLEMHFIVKDSVPYIIITDGDTSLKTFSGCTAYEDGMAFIESTL
jgi:hypothetical protein